MAIGPLRAHVCYMHLYGIGALDDVVGAHEIRPACRMYDSRTFMVVYSCVILNYSPLWRGPSAWTGW
jgi:hypothetical protein